MLSPDSSFVTRLLSIPTGCWKQLWLESFYTLSACHFNILILSSLMLSRIFLQKRIVACLGDENNESSEKCDIDWNEFYELVRKPIIQTVFMDVLESTLN